MTRKVAQAQQRTRLQSYTFPVCTGRIYPAPLVFRARPREGKEWPAL